MMAKRDARQHAEYLGSAAAKDYLCQTRTNLKQWRMLQAVVELGSFSTAAEFLNVSQATVSYTIARLEEELGVSILKMDGRKYKLTEVGNDLLQRSRVVLRTVVALERYATTIRQGAAPEVKVAVSQCFPTRFLMPTLRRFSAHWRHAKVSLIEVPQTDVEKVLYEHAADIVINERVPSGFSGNVLIEMEYVAVASPDHPLFQKGRELSEEDLSREVRIVSKDELPESDPALVIDSTEKQWYVSNFETAVAAVCEGIGYGWLPKDRIKDSLEQGRLKILPLQQSASYKMNFYLIRGQSAIASADAMRLAQALQTAMPPNEDGRPE